MTHFTSAVTHPRPLLTVALALLLSAGCSPWQLSRDGAQLSFSQRTTCPDPVEGQAAGADSPERALACFRKATEERSPSLLLRVSCRGRSPVSCKQGEGAFSDAQGAILDLGQVSWTSTLGQWSEGRDSKTFAIDTHPGEERVSLVTTCRIAHDERWAVCELGELSRKLAEQKLEKAR